MSKKSVFAALFLIFIGIIFGVVLVSSFRGVVMPGFAGGPDVKLGAQNHIKQSTSEIKALNKAFIEVSKAVTPTVVAITVTTKGKGRSEGLPDFFHFFGPDFKFREPEPQQGSGSGVIISPDGYIMTNNHVVDGADDDGVEVIHHQSRRMKAKVIGTDPTTDLAIIKVDAKELPTAAFGNSDQLEVGEWVLAVGNPLGLQSTVTAGIISAIGRGDIGVIRDSYRIENFIQTDAAINPGNSGGPLVNLNGEVIGINTAIATTNARYQGYGFAIPINLARTVAEDLIRHGKVRRGYIGVRIGAVDEITAKAVGLDEAKGVLVQSLEEGGAAEAAGIKDGDIILSVDAKEVNAPNQLQSYIASKHPDDEVMLKIFRDGKTLEKKVTLRARKEEALTAKDDKKDSEETETERETSRNSITVDNLGLTVATLTSKSKNEYDVNNGVLVNNVERFSEAYNRGLQEGDVILEVDKKELYSPKDLKSVIEKRKPGDALLLRVKGKDKSTRYVALEIPK
ncbi:MAG: Do family serine endopeptidase [Ignavibacteriae bacterium]|nr:Do family serine endopeptidase [Ignavibacteriota bacterium]